jgi:hypothetical protein
MCCGTPPSSRASPHPQLTPSRARISGGGRSGGGGGGSAEAVAALADAATAGSASAPWLTAAYTGDFAAVLRWAAVNGYYEVEGSEQGMPALDMQLGTEAPTYFEMLGFSEYGMTDSHLPALTEREASLRTQLRALPPPRRGATAGTSSSASSALEPVLGLLGRAARTLRSAASRRAYRESLAQYRQDTLLIVHEYHEEQRRRVDKLLEDAPPLGSASPSAVASWDRRAAEEAVAQLVHTGLLVQLTEVRCDLALTRNEFALREEEITAAAVAAVSHSCACIGSPCLRCCGHGAPIGGGGGGGGGGTPAGGY